MSGKKRAIEKANKRLLSESLPAPINFSEHEVFNILWETYGNDIPEELIKNLQEALKKKGRVFPKEGEGAPEGAFY